LIGRSSEGEQAGLVAADQRLEGVVVAAPDQPDQAFVALEPQQRRARMSAGQAAGVGECGDFQGRWGSERVPPG
jgi:hypothetical protein